MARVFTKNILIDAAAITDAAAGDGVSGYTYGSAQWAYDFKAGAVAGGYVVTASSTRTSGTGTVANGVSDTDQWSSAFKVAYESSWIAMRHAATGAAIVMQRDFNAAGWRIKIATSGTYNIASGGTATRVPTLSGEKIVLGSGTDGSPVFEGLCPATGSFVMQISGDTAKGDVYAVGYPAAGSATGGDGFFLACGQLSLGRSGAATQFWIVRRLTTPILADLDDDTTSYCWALVRKGLTSPSPTIERVKMLAVGSIPGTAATNPATGAVAGAYIRMARDTAPADWLGRCDDLYWYGGASSVPRTGTLSTSKDRLVIGPLILPWDGTEPV